MATNRIDILDSALLRPGRIDRKIEFPPPNPEARITILKIHSRKVGSLLPLYPTITNAQMSLQRGINFRSLAEKMGNCSGAEVRGICTEAGEFSFDTLVCTGPADHQECTLFESDGSMSVRKTSKWPSPRS
jgi:26S proteasome regulatory subunit T6